ncbi:MAG TPA: hypothetical protein VH436_00075 [Vicinamibacterales bacterium]
MADQNQQHGRRPHFHRGRRGPDRRGNDRRHTPPQEQQQASRDHVDVEQIMREIRARISQRHGIDLSTQQIQELAARRLEAILDPRTVKPSLLEQLRRSAGAPVETRSSEPALSYTFEATTLYESPSGFVRFMRRLLHPILRLFFNPNPVIETLHMQAQINQAALAREAERDRRQAEWNALHYEILQRLVTEISRTSLEGQGLSMRVESLAAKVDFNERRVRGVENTMHQARPAPRPSESAAQAPSAPMPPREGTPPESQATDGGGAREGALEGGRRRRRRRRGRRSPMGTPFEGSAPAMPAGEQSVAAAGAPGEIDVEADIDDEEDEPTLSDSLSPDTEETISSSPAPPQPEPAYVVDRFVSTVQKVPDAPLASEAMSPERAAPEPVAPEPAAPAPSSPTPADHPQSSDPNE